MIKLSSRLKALADYIEDNDSMVDIGCDHGLLDIYLTLNKKNVKVIASDVNENALNNAKKNIKKYNLEDKISKRKSDFYGKFISKKSCQIRRQLSRFGGTNQKKCRYHQC